MNAYNNGNRYSGIGIALEKTGLVGVDFDHCRNPETGEIEPWALEYVKRLNSYTESSPSGTGLRVFLYGEIKNPGNKKGNIECYTSGRYLTVTGHHLEGTPRTIEHRQDEFDKFHEAVFGCVKEKKTEALPLVISDLDETEVVHRAINAKNGEDFRRLYAGDWSGYPSQSEADLAFLSLCAFWTGRDPARMESIFRASGLFRKKTDQHYSDGSTYLSRTIAKAIDGTGEIYQCRQAPGCNVQDVSKTCPGQDQDTMSVIAQPSQTPVYNLTDVGNGLRFRDMWDNVHFNSMKGAWQFYDDTHWVLDAVGKIMQFAKATAREIYAEAARERDDDHRKALVSHAARSESIPRLEAMLKAASTEDGIPVLPDQLDSNPWLLNVLNGTVDLRDRISAPASTRRPDNQAGPGGLRPPGDLPQVGRFFTKNHAR